MRNILVVETKETDLIMDETSEEAVPCRRLHHYTKISV